ncbi:MAG: folate-binding protein [Sphingomonadaceae bacterium]|uniref:CAF17-like 4Fe-4S cluster assembly/insertion protein YgfZ n=1 Tax=Thermaurantiacus sp. TaxID=2820283 RepID=UPI00298ED428|nr:folate-binding protein [Thermaurantiacus sp.]MCS6986971.1 folate-binding protein [Sphingomonadaceae bacterium]MDW8415429.1 folate-binding protein [Thermaurantiacus sp.]
MPLAHLEGRRVIRVSGGEARDFLQGLLTQDITRLAGASPLWAGLLSPQGKAQFAMFLHADGEDVLIDVEGAVADALMKRLALYRLRRPVGLEATDLAVYAAWGPEAAGHPADPRWAGAGARWVAPAGAHVPNADEAAYRRHRLALGLPDQAEVEDLLWLETNAAELHGVSFTKGCYVGQENTARMHHRDRVRRRLLPLELSGPPGHERVWAGEREAGVLRGSPEGPVVLAHLRLELLDRPLEVAGHPARLLRPPWLPAEAF